MTQVAPYPPGITLQATDSVKRKAKTAISTHEQVKGDLSKLGKLKIFFKQTEAGALVRVIEKRAKALTRVLELAKEFRMVTLDESIKRKVTVETRWNGPVEVSVPFVFSSKLPAKTKKAYTVNIASRTTPGMRRRLIVGWPRRSRVMRCTVSAVVPLPPDAALEALQKHGKKFTHTEVWWVPKDVTVREIQEPSPADPIVVGVILAPRKNRDPERFCFELYRWEQADLEKPYFAHEAY